MYLVENKWGWYISAVICERRFPPPPPLSLQLLLLSLSLLLVYIIVNRPEAKIILKDYSNNDRIMDRFICTCKTSSSDCKLHEGSRICPYTLERRRDCPCGHLTCGQHTCKHNRRSRDCWICKEKICKTDGCLSKSQPKYQDYCKGCFVVIFPETKILNHKIKENAVFNRVHAVFGPRGYNIIHDRPLTLSKTKYRPDIRIEIDSEYDIIIEIDENQHRGYIKDPNERINQIHKDLNRKIVLIRFNPDSYTTMYSEVPVKDKGCLYKYIEKSCWKKGSSGVIQPHRYKWETRMVSLLHEIQFWITHKPRRDNITTIYLYYNSIELSF